MAESKQIDGDFSEVTGNLENKVNSAGAEDVVGDEELDALLNDALSDFDKPLPAPRQKESVPSDSSASALKSDDMNQVWSEEFIKEATMQFEKKMREYAVAGQSQGVATTPGASTSMTNEIHKVVEAATKAALLGTSDPNLEATFNDAIKGLAVNPELMNSVNPTSFNDDELSKLMGSLGMGEPSETDMEDFFPFMSNMMQKLLSKELLQPVLSDIVDRYPDWLADNREKISGEEFDKYNTQYDNMKKICEEYSKEKADDSEETKQTRFDIIADLMLKVQAAGPPPKELVGEDEADAFMQPNAALGQQCSLM